LFANCTFGELNSNQNKLAHLQNDECF